MIERKVLFIISVFKENKKNGFVPDVMLSGIIRGVSLTTEKVICAKKEKLISDHISW